VWRLKPHSRPERLREALFWTICVYLFFASTVHPWYIVLPLALGFPATMDAGARFWRFSLIWSALAALSYSHYRHNAFLEQKSLIALEYALVGGVLLFETARLFFQKRKSAS
jgi:alpha-1,6-mannosyltransferase